MTLSERLREHVRACFPAIWIESHEHDDALAEMAGLCRDENWQLARWDIDQGLEASGVALSDAHDPLAAIRSLSALASPDGAALLVLVNFHRFLGSAEIVQALMHQISQGKQNRTAIVILSPLVQIPVELEKQFVVIEHELPTRAQLEEIARGIATESGEFPESEDREALLDASVGLTRQEAENAYSLSLVRHGTLTAETIWSMKAQMLKKSGLLRLHRGEESFSNLGGLEALKGFCQRAMRRNREADPLRRPRGVLLLGVPGVGKSAFAKSLGQETGRPTLLLDVGSLMGSLVGETESNVRQALRIADAMAPCILFMDEVEKGLSGLASSGRTDSGVSARLFGTVLTWLSDHTSDVFVVCTCNDIRALPPEFSRAERFDAVYFLDLPGQQQKQAIWRMYQTQFGLDAVQPLPADESWTGAEIRACCRLAALLEVPLIEAARHIVPVAVTSAESIDTLRQWASGRCLDAEQAGLYRHQPDKGKRSRRNIPRDPSMN